MDIYEHETAEILWRRIVDIRNGAGPNEDPRAIPATAASAELRELTALAEDLQCTLVDDPAFAQNAARARFLRYLSGQEAPAPMRPSSTNVWDSVASLFRRRKQAVLLAALLILAATAVFAWTMAIRQPAGTCGTDASPIPPAAGAPAPASGAAAPAAAGQNQDPGSDCTPAAAPPSPSIKR